MTEVQTKTRTERVTQTLTRTETVTVTETLTETVIANVPAEVETPIRLSINNTVEGEFFTYVYGEIWNPTNYTVTLISVEGTLYSKEGVVLERTSTPLTVPGVIVPRSKAYIEMLFETEKFKEADRIKFQVTSIHLEFESKPLNLKIKSYDVEPGVFSKVRGIVENVGSEELSAFVGVVVFSSEGKVIGINSDLVGFLKPGESALFEVSFNFYITEDMKIEVYLWSQP